MFDMGILVGIMSSGLLFLYDTHLLTRWRKDIADLCDHDEALTLLRSHEADIRHRPFGNIYLKIKGIF